MSISIRSLPLPLPFSAAAMLAMVLAAVATPLRAQGIPDARVTVLESRMNRLEPEVQTDHVVLGVVKTRLDQALKDIATLQQRLQAEEIRTAALESAVGGLLKGQPVDPGKTPPAPNQPTPGQPTDNKGSSVKAPFTVKDSVGRILFTVDAVPGGNTARAIVGDAGGNRVEIGPQPDGAAAVTLFDASSTMLATLVGDHKGSFLRVKDSDLSVMLGHTEPEGRGLFLRKDAKDILTLTPDKTNAGTVKVFGSTGSAVVGLYADDNGGQLVLTGPTGGKTAASVSVTPSGGKVRVFPVGGGTARAELVAKDAGGAINLFAIDGTNVASLASLDAGSGRLEVNDIAGRIVVEAGVTKVGAGYLTTGPYDTGVAASMLSVGKPASSLLGSTKSK